MKKRLFLLIIFLLIFPNIYAHGEEELPSADTGGDGLVDYFASTSVYYVLIGSAIVILITLVSIFYKKKNNNTKWVLFLFILIPVVLVTFYITGATLYLNYISHTKGPVHWHADFEIWNCGEEIDLIDPEGFSNRVGNPVFHEHGDNRIHVEGVVINKKQASLHRFFDFVGGNLDDDLLELPTNDGILNVRNGDLCNGEKGELQVFVYKVLNPADVKNWEYEQVKIDDFENYVLSQYQNVPPGDCIIVEFDIEKNKTDKICTTFEVGSEQGHLTEEEHGS